MKILSLLFLSALLVSPLTAHPGTLAKDGCHRCKKNCAPHGKDGERHCHDSDADPVATKNPPTMTVNVVEVIDGDTLRVKTKGKVSGELTVRILGIDCPESKRNPKCLATDNCGAQLKDGEAATDALKKMVDGKTVVLTTWKKDFETDRYKRTLAYVLLPTDEEKVPFADVGRALVKSGYCKDYGHKYPHPRSSEYRR